MRTIMVPGQRSSRVPALGRFLALPLLLLALAPFHVGTANASLPLFDTPVMYPTGNGPFTAAYGDLNGDGYPDVVTANWIGSGISVLLSTGDFSFQPADNYDVPYSVAYVAIGDIDEDGDLDLVAPIYNDGVIAFFTNDGEGAFRREKDMAFGGNPSCVALMDFSGDGHLDLAVTRDQDAVAPNLVLYAGNGRGGFADWTAMVTSCGANRIAVADLDQNGRLDIAVSAYHGCGPGLSVHLNDPAAPGGFISSIRKFADGGAYGIVAANLDGDTFPDLAITSDAGGMARVLLNQGDGTFGPDALYGKDRNGNDGTLSVVAADFNQDGAMDLVLGNRGFASITPLFGNGDGTFAVQQDVLIGNRPSFLITTDFDLDGKADVLATLENSDHVAVIFGNGDGSFMIGPYLNLGARPTDVAIADFNQDGFQDIVAAMGANPGVAILVNQGDGQNYLKTTIDNWEARNLDYVVATDVTGDGKPDLVLEGLGRLVVFRNDYPNWTHLQTRTYLLGGHGLAVGDLNLDGIQDYVITFTGSNPFSGNREERVAAYLGLGGGYFETTPLEHDLPGGWGRDPKIVDTTRDGYPDLIVARPKGGTVSVLTGNGDGTFKSLSNNGSGKYAFSVAVGDLNADERYDLVAGNDLEATLSVLLGAGGGGNGYKSRVKYDASTCTRSLELVDFNGDGMLDVAGVGPVRSPNFANMAGVFSGNGDGTLGSSGFFPVGINPLSLATGDLDGNGSPDLVVANFSSLNLSVLLNRGNGLLEPVPASTDAVMARAVARAGATGSRRGATVSPNPLNPDATLSFSVERMGTVRIGLYDLQGRLVRTLLDDPGLAPGRHQVRIDGRDNHGRGLATGVYFYRVETPGGKESGRVTILK